MSKKKMVYRHTKIMTAGREIGGVAQARYSLQCRHLKGRYPKILIDPLYYRVEDDLLYQLAE